MNVSLTIILYNVTTYFDKEPQPQQFGIVFQRFWLKSITTNQSRNILVHSTYFSRTAYSFVLFGTISHTNLNSAITL